ncbi:MAG: hypothetical protein ACPGJV_13645 [Bacteriovoracaceae bacterium]
MKIVLVLLLFPFLTAQSALFPEDGTGIVSTWNYGRSATSLIGFEETKRAFQELGIRTNEVPIYYEWIQDITLMNDEGYYLNQAVYPQDYNIAYGLSIGVFGDPEEFQPMQRLNGRGLGLPTKSMKYTLVEGGELISGYFPNGEGYALVRDYVVYRVRNYLSYHRIDKDPIEAIAEDFGLKPENIFSLSAPAHLDLYLKAMPNGTVFVHSMEKTIELLKKLSLEDQTYSLLYDRYKNGVKHFNIYEQVYSQYPLEDQRVTDQLNKISEVLSEKFNVVRVAGYIKEDKYSGRHINFLNAVSGISPRGEKFYLTSMGQGLDKLEDYWKKIMAENGFHDFKTKFVWRSGSGTGLDCASFLTP